MRARQRRQTRLGLHAEALQQIDLALQTKRSDADAYNNRGNAYSNKKDYDSAIAAYNEVLKTDPNNDKAKIGIGMTNLEKGDLDAAEKTLQDASQSLSATREVYYDLGEVEFAKGKNDEATKAFTAAKADPRMVKAGTLWLQSL